MYISFNTPQIPLRTGTQKKSYIYSLQPFWKLFTNSEATSLSDQDCTYINKLFIVFIHQGATATYVKMCISFQFPVLRSTLIILIINERTILTLLKRTKQQDAPFHKQKGKANQ